jgi:alanyl-tRNA synthetase
VPDALATGGLRVVEVQDFDSTACGGTHVAHTGEIGLIKLLRLEKYKGGTRVEFACGGRALRAFQQRVEVTLALTAALTCALPDLPAQVARLQDDLRTRERTIKTQQEALAEYEAVTLLSEANWHGDARLVIAVYDDGRDAAAIRLLAARLVREPGVIALLGTVGDKTHVVCARSAELPHDMAVVLKRTLVPLGGKGGGQPQQAQGGAGPASAEQVRAALLAGLG